MKHGAKSLGVLIVDDNGRDSRTEEIRKAIVEWDSKNQNETGLYVHWTVEESVVALLTDPQLDFQIVILLNQHSGVGRSFQQLKAIFPQYKFVVIGAESETTSAAEEFAQADLRADSFDEIKEQLQELIFGARDN